jgi:hypothetical protein
MQNQNSNTGLQSRSEQSGAAKVEMTKFIVIVWNHKEQVIAFPFHVQHSAVFEYVRRENPQVQVVSAGFFIADGDIFWLGGRSETLDLDSRPQDADLVKAFLASPERSEWDLSLMTPGGAK